MMYTASSFAAGFIIIILILIILFGYEIHEKHIHIDTHTMIVREREMQTKKQRDERKNLQKKEWHLMERKTGIGKASCIVCLCVGLIRKAPAAAEAGV